jgi:subtilisin-like proprotein convertase family protein
MFKQLMTGAMMVGTASAVLLAAAPQAFAIPFTYGNNTSATIPDNNFTGISRDIVVSDPGNVGELSVSITGLTHDWVGDLIASLTHVETNTKVDLFNQIGKVTNTGTGDGSNFNGTYSFSNTFTTDIWAAAAAVTSDVNITPGNYAPSTFKTSGAANVAPVSSLTLFNGQNLAGTWRLTVSDRAFGDTGSFSGWTLSGNTASTPVPVPPQVLGTAMLAGLTAAKKLRQRKVIAA